MSCRNKSRKYVHKLYYQNDVNICNNGLFTLFYIDLPIDTIASLKLELSVYDINTNLCNVYNIKNAFKFIGRLSKQIKGNDILSFEELTPININYILINNIININIKNPPLHLRYIGKLTVTLFKL